MATNENLPPNIIKQLLKELRNLDESPPEGIKVVVINDDFSTIFADIEGPAGTPYENGIFRMKLLLSSDFPQSPPKGFFVTKIFHPNISSSGEICVNTLKKDWNPSLGLTHVLLVIRCLLIEPFPESALNEQAGRMLLENYQEYAHHARIYTGIHATKSKPKFKTGAMSESTTTLNVEHKPSAVALQPPVSSTLASASPSRMAATDHGNGTMLPGPSVDECPRRKVMVMNVTPADKKKMDARKKSLKRL